MHKLGIAAFAGAICVSTAWGAQITQFSPRGVVAKVESVKLSFNRPVIAFGNGQAPPPVRIECDDPELSGNGRWLDGKRWTYVFTDNPGPGVTCKAELDPSFQALNNEPVTGKTSFSFQTGGPIVTSMRPYGSTIAEDQVFALRFNGAVDSASLLKHSRCLVQGLGEAVPLRLITGDARKQILDVIDRSESQDWDTEATQLLQCTRRLPAQATVELSVGPGVATLTRQGRTALASNKPEVFEFKVREAFKASFTCMRENASMPCTPVSPISVQFSAPVSPDDARQIRLQTPSASLAPDIDDAAGQQNGLWSVQFSPAFPEQADMRLSLPEGLKDDAGRVLVNADQFPLSFRTAAFPPLVKFSSGSFGVIERFADAGPGHDKAKAQASVPLTVRNVEAALATQDMLISTGTIDDYVTQNDRDTLQWYARVQRLENRRLTRNQLKDVMAGKALRSEDQPMLDTRGFSALAGLSDVRSLRLPGMDADDPRPFEVIGVPLSEPGLHILEVESAKLGHSLLETQEPMYVRSAVLLTNLGVHVKTGRDDTLAWVTTLDEGKVVPDASITVLDCSGKLLAQGKTDSEGIWHHQQALDAPDYCEDTGLRGLYVAARIPADHPQAGGKADFSFVLSEWNDGIESWRFNVPTDTQPEPTVVVHTVFDRTLLRAGETVSMKHFVRVQTRDGLALPAASDMLPGKLLIEHLGSDQRYEQTLNWQETPSGGLSAIAQFAVPETARLGEYSVRVTDEEGRWYGSSEFRVEEFKLPLLTGNLKISDGQGRPFLVAPESLDADVQLAYLSGGPAGQLPVRISGVVQDWQPSFQDYDDYSFSAPEFADNEAALQDKADTDNQALFLDKQALVLDAQGGGRLNVASLPAFTRARSLLFEASFSDPNGQIQTLAQSVPVWPAAVQAGLKADGWVEAGKDTHVSVLALSLDGRPQANVPITVTAVARTTYSTRKRMVGGFYSYDNHTETRDLGTLCTGRTGQDGALACTVSLQDSGAIELIATAQDEQGRSSAAASSLWVTGAGDLWFGGENDDRIDIIPAKKEWKPGETAEFQVRMPFREATALVAVEREGVLATRVVRLHGSDPTIRLPIEAEWGPNVYVSVLALRGRQYDVPWQSFFDQGWRQPLEWYRAYSEARGNQTAATQFVDLAKPSFRFGLTEIRVSDHENTLAVSVQPDKKTYQVRGEASVAIEVKLPDGQPAAYGTVAFAAVDQALLELAPNRSWDLLTAMRQLRSYGVETATAQMQVVGRRHYGRKALPAGGGGGKSPTRELLDTLLLWEPSILLDEHGKAVVKLPLNDSITQFQLVAVADFGPDRFGTGKASIVSTQDLQVIEGLPALAREGDQYRATVTLRNSTQRDMHLQVKAAYEGNGVPPEALPVQEVEVAAGAARTVSWDIQAPESNLMGETSILNWTLSAQEQLRQEQGGSIAAASDALSFRQTLLPAVPVRARQATLLPLDGNKPELALPVSVPLGALTDANGLPRGGLQVSLRSTLAGGLPGVQQWFAAYPYTCLEQVSSKAIGLREQSDWDEIMRRLPDYLDEDGLAAYFPGTIHGNEVLTAYLLSVSHEAQSLGLPFAIPEASRQAMQGGLLAFVQGKLVRHRWSPVQDLDARKLMALEALSRYERLQPRLLDSISITPDRWPTSAVINWMALLQRMPDIPDQQAQLTRARQIILARMLDRGTEMVLNEDAHNDNWWLMAGRASNQASLLLHAAGQPAWEQDLPRMAQGLLNMQRNGAWRTTTANLLGSLAIEKFSRYYESKPLSGQLRIATAQEGEVQTFDWNAVKANHGVKAHEFFLPWGREPSDTLVLTQQGEGRAWATVRSLAAVPVAQDIAAGYVLHRSVKPVSQAAAGAWSRGDVYRVTLTIDAKSPMTWVVLTDPIPAGASVLGGGLGRDSSIATRSEENSSSWYGPSFIERSFESYRAYYDYLPKGKSTLEYTVRLNTVGQFQLPSTRIEAMYQPDVYGELAGPTSMEVRDGAKP
ncbi:alpha-2-macroglobulin family protein [Pollutimonas harenae]|uniref:alpha-2-macroglobulin family protein n=1 Tax=Pollutimonas harenae TaxID=657015 RepID=UPI001FD6F50D|nr:MG2 domain-containing protein [Pollutimonas harenae]